MDAVQLSDIEKISLLQVRPFDGTRYSRASLHSVQPRYLLCETFSDRSVLLIQNTANRTNLYSLEVFKERMAY